MSASGPEGMALEPKRRAKRGPGSPRGGHMTKEARALSRHDSPTPYFRLEDDLCRSFLRVRTRSLAG
jgi:hypothetical protein